MNMPMPPSPADFEAALRRIEFGTVTASDAALIREYVGEVYEGLDWALEELKATQRSLDAIQRSLDVAFNTGDGAYRP